MAGNWILREVQTQGEKEQNPEAWLYTLIKAMKTDENWSKFKDIELVGPWCSQAGLKLLKDLISKKNFKNQ